MHLPGGLLGLGREAKKGKIRGGRVKVLGGLLEVKEEWQKVDSRGMCECTGTVGY